MGGIVAAEVVEDLLELRDVLQLVDQAEAQVDVVAVLAGHLRRLPTCHFPEEEEVRQLHIGQQVRTGAAFL